MSLERSFVKLAIGGGCVLGGVAFPPLLAGEGIVWGTALATALGSVAAGNTANAIDALADRLGSDRGVSLENQDLTKAVGKAIAAVITLAAQSQRGKTRQHLEKIAAQAKDNWIKIAQQELTQHRYPELREGQLDQFLTPDEYHLTQQGNLTATEWGDIFIRLNMAACKGGGFFIPAEVRQDVAKLLHTTFPKALRETLKEDFANDGKAFAGLTLQLLTGMQAQLSQLQISQAELNAEELAQILEQFQELETQLRGTVAQQQAFFNQISQDIDSGFAEVCHQLGVMETHITQLLQGLESTLESLVAEIRSHFDTANPNLSLEEWRPIAQLMLANRQALTANSAFKRVDVYVPLGLVERRQPKQPKPDQNPETQEQGSEREEEKVTPIAEDAFFDQVLQQGKSPKSQGRRIAITGEPGSGKTTRLQAIADWILAEDLGIPIWIPLAEFTESTLVDHLQEKWLKLAGVEGAITSLQDHKEHLWLLMDGLDEMVARIERPHVSQLLTGWVQSARVIITCRVNVWEADQNAFSGFDVYRNLPFEVEQMEMFIRRFFAQSD
ncbi:NACHT domain-containing protein [Spirulina subsalsa CS-330]|uniref:NACHT domain-containing protein n=1 Tax=Spirulina TaxID=1154 RepID=UPI00232B0C62|nr:NACHT domain-containing protein [Spirulina subsalsa]MDB9494968.1 NACHT domain-containing protein [Spirulina subsalsa CS-330]